MPDAGILDASGNLVRSVTPAKLAAWRSASGRPESEPAAALARIDIGEYLLSQNRQPDEAIAELDSVASMPSVPPDLVAQSRYDRGLALWAEGAYRECMDTFASLSKPTSALPETQRRMATLWYRAAAGCEQYHAGHAAMGIPEPPKLDPYCGDSALAVYLRTVGMPSGRALIADKCHTTGEGNSFGDLIAGGKALGIAVHTVTATDRGLELLPKPLIAHVEQDHFIAVVGADKAGVSYICSDCGPWPGGRVNLTWRQWHALQADVFGVMVRPGSAWDIALSAAGKASHRAVGVRVASIGAIGDLVPAALRIEAMLKGAVVVTYTPTPQCDRLYGVPCLPGLMCCPLPPPSGGVHPLVSSGVGMNISGPNSGYGPSSGDPVIAATGNESYQPGPDLTVYNPDGPSVTWQRQYESMSTTSGSDFGAEWVNTYAYTVAIIPQNGQYGPTDYSVVFTYPNGAQIQLYAQSAPTALAPTTTLYMNYANGIFSTPFPTDGYDFDLAWDYTSSSSEGEVVMTRKDHTVWTFGPTNGAAPYGFGYALTNIASPNGFGAAANSIDFTYTAVGSQYFGESAVISKITDHGSGTVLLTVSRDSNNMIDKVTDCYGRIVNYASGTYMSPQYPNFTTIELNTVSEIGASTGPTPPTRYTYGYTFLHGPAPAYDEYTISDGPPLLSTITVPSPTGTGSSTAQIYYSGFAAKMVDGNGNAIVMASSTATGGSSEPSDYTEVVDQDSSGATWYEHVVGYTANMTAASSADFGSGLQSSVTAWSGNDPYRPATVYDGDALYTLVPGGSATLSPFGGDAPGSGHSWEIYSKSGVLVDYSATNGSTGANGWTVTGTDSSGIMTIAVTAPSTAAIGAHYEVRSGATSPSSAFFDVYTHTKGATTETWDSVGNLDSVTDPRGMTTQYTYDTSSFPLGVLTTVQVSNGSAIKAPTTYTYGAQGGEASGLISEIDSPVPGTTDGSTYVATKYDYDQTGYVAGETNLNLRTEEDAPGNSGYAEITSRWNYFEDAQYDVNGHPVGGSYVPYSVTTSAIGEPLVFINGAGKETHYRYDELGDCTMVIDALGNETDYTFNLAKQMTSMTQYTPWNATPSHSPIAATVYNYLYVGGPLMSVQTENSAGAVVRETDYTYGKEGELLTESAVDDSQNPPVSHLVLAYTYDPLYRVASITDGNGNVTTYTYSPTTGNLSLVQYPGAGSDTSGADTVNYPAYDSDGNLLTRLDGNGVETDYLYDDPDSLLTYVAYPTGTIAPVTHTYDLFGRHAGMSDGVFLANGTTPGEAFAYDDLDNVTTKTVNYSTSVAALEGLQVAYTYNADGSRASMTVPIYPQNNETTGTFEYTYDDDGRQVGETDPAGNIFSWTYLDNSWLGSQVSENKAGDVMVDTTYGYDARGELTDLRNYKAGLTSLWSEFGGDGIGSDPLPMTYDASGNRLSMPASQPDYSTYSGTVDYTYDYKNELTSEASTRNGGSGLPVDNAFDYDGNFTELRGASVSSANSDDQLTGSGDVYDGNGNPTTYGGAALTYDPENRLVAYAAGGTTDMTAGYGYDGLRAWRRAASTTVYFLYDGMDPVVQLSSTGVVDDVNDFGANGLIARHSQFYPPAGYLDRFYAFDPQGNAAEMVASDGGAASLLQSATYDAFGEQSAYPTTYAADAYAHYGAQWGYFTDKSQPLELLGHRYYDASEGRFVTRDPIGYAGGFDPYEFCFGNPSIGHDPSGWKPIIACGRRGHPRPPFPIPPLPPLPPDPCQSKPVHNAGQCEAVCKCEARGNQAGGLPISSVQAIYHWCVAMCKWQWGGHHGPMPPLPMIDPH